MVGSAFEAAGHQPLHEVTLKEEVYGGGRPHSHHEAHEHAGAGRFAGDVDQLEGDGVPLGLAGDGQAGPEVVVPIGEEGDDDQRGQGRGEHRPVDAEHDGEHARAVHLSGVFVLGGQHVKVLLDQEDGEGRHPAIEEQRRPLAREAVAALPQPVVAAREREARQQDVLRHDHEDGRHDQAREQQQEQRAAAGEAEAREYVAAGDADKEREHEIEAHAHQRDQVGAADVVPGAHQAGPVEGIGNGQQAELVEALGRGERTEDNVEHGVNHQETANR